MEQTISQFENLNLNENFFAKHLKKEPFSTQKCYSSTVTFSIFNVSPGHPVFLKNGSQIFLCKLYPKPFLADNTIEFDKSVYLPIGDKCLFENKSNLAIKKCSKTCQIESIDVEVVFDVLKDLIFWHNKEEEFSLLLKNYILKCFVISNECHIDLENMLAIQRFGIHKLLLKLKDETSDQCIGKISENTNVHISKFTYKNKYELEHCILPPLYGMENSIERLVDIVNINKQIFNTKNNYLQPSKQVFLN